MPDVASAATGLLLKITTAPNGRSRCADNQKQNDNYGTFGFFHLAASLVIEAEFDKFICVGMIFPPSAST
jgi:hypothetical protein